MPSWLSAEFSPASPSTSASRRTATGQGPPKDCATAGWKLEKTRALSSSFRVQVLSSEDAADLKKAPTKPRRLGTQSFANAARGDHIHIHPLQPWSVCTSTYLFATTSSPTAFDICGHFGQIAAHDVYRVSKSLPCSFQKCGLCEALSAKHSLWCLHHGVHNPQSFLHLLSANVTGLGLVRIATRATCITIPVRHGICIDVRSAASLWFRCCQTLHYRLAVFSRIITEAPRSSYSSVSGWSGLQISQCQSADAIFLELGAYGR